MEKFYNLGDPVLFYDMKMKEWKKGTALVRLGKTLYLRFGNFLRRVTVEKVRPDYHGEVNAEESYVEPDDDDERFAAEETPVVDLAKDLHLAEENVKLKEKIVKLEERELEPKSDEHDTIEKETKVGTKLEKKKALKKELTRKLIYFLN